MRNNAIFKSMPFDKDLDFVFLTQNLDYLSFLTNGDLPVRRELIEEGISLPFLWLEVQMIKDLKQNIDELEDSYIKSKYIATYSLYKLKYSKIIEQLEKSGFNLATINSEVNWKEASMDWWQL